MNDHVQLYEELSMNAHPSLQTQVYDGWILRFANGYSNRANSVIPLYPSALDLRTKISECEKRYFTQGLSAAYKLTDGSDPDIGKELDRQAYAVVTPTYVMDMDLRDKDFSSGNCVMTNYADDEWLNAYFSFSRYSDGVKKATAKQIFESVKNIVICGRTVKSGASVACGAAVIERGYAALLNVVVDEPQRGKGYGRDICASLLSAARRFGAHTAYLQVVRDNNAAVNLYAKLGYRTRYSYWYRIKKEGA